jgi:DNA polymerase III subunit delta'
MSFSFSSVIGQAAVKNRLTHSFHEGRVPHAMLFNGKEGTGALGLAMGMSRFLLCENKQTDESCGQCKACKAVDTLQHPDLHFSFPFFNLSGKEKTTADEFLEDWRKIILETTYFNTEYWISQITKENKQLLFPVQEANRIAHKVFLKSFYGGPKIMIIWMAEMIKEDTANKLLKILEEPPAQTIFILVTESIEQMLPTVLSRVQQIQVPILSGEEIKAVLLHNEVDEERAQLATTFANGNWWKAMQFAGNENFNQGLDEVFQQWMRLCYKKDLFHLTEMSNTFQGWGREVQKQFFEYALEQVRQNLMKNYVGEDFVQMTPGEVEFASKFSKFINHFNVEDLMNTIAQASYYVARNLNGKLLFMQLSLQVHHLLRRNSYVA